MSRMASGLCTQAVPFPTDPCSLSGAGLKVSPAKGSGTGEQDWRDSLGQHGMTAPRYLALLSLKEPRKTSLNLLPVQFFGVESLSGDCERDLCGVRNCARSSGHI